MLCCVIKMREKFNKSYFQTYTSFCIVAYCLNATNITARNMAESKLSDERIQEVSKVK